MTFRPELPGWNQACTAVLVVLALTGGTAPLAWTYMTGNYAWAVAVSRDGRYLIAGSDDMHTYFFDSHSADGKPAWSYAARGYVRHVAISKDGTRAAASDTDGNIFLFESTHSGNPIWSYRADSVVTALAMTEDGDYLAAGDRRGTVYFLSKDARDPAVWPNVIPGGVLALSLSTSTVLAATATQGGLYFFGEALSQHGYIWSFEEGASFPQLAMTDRADYIVIGGSDGSICLIDSLGQLRDRQRVKGAISALSISNTRPQVVAGSTNGTVVLYLMQAKLDKIDSLQTADPITSVALSDNGARIAVANLDGRISVFNRSLSSQMWGYDSGAIVHSLSISSDGRVLAAATDAGAIHLFNEEVVSTAKTGQEELVSWIPIVAVVILVIGYFAWRKRK